MSTIRLALLASGGGTTVAAILDAITATKLIGIEPALIIASRPEAGVIEKAKVREVPDDDIEVIVRKGKTAEEFGTAINEACIARNAHFIGQYGWLPMTPLNVVTAFQGRMINQHPGALDPECATPEMPHPDFGGKGMHGRAAIAAALYFAQETDGNWWVEATAHLVAPAVDAGSLVRFERMGISSEDTVESIQKRLLPIDHAVQIAVLADLAEYGVIRTARRPEPLILPRHYDALRRAKERAVRDYPNG
jgi:phosphoribosylglycinamide formyltransferase-1